MYQQATVTQTFRFQMPGPSSDNSSLISSTDEKLYLQMLRKLQMENESLRARVISLENALQEEVPPIRTIQVKQTQLPVNTPDGIRLLAINEIIRLEAERAYTMVCLLNGNKYVLSKPLCVFETELEAAGFIRTHKSHLVNSSFAIGIQNNTALQLKDGSSVPLARRRRQSVLNALCAA